MKRIIVLAGLLAVGVTASAQKVLAAKWIAAPWSTVRDGAEVDGSQPLPIFRRAFKVSGTIVRAELRIAGLGQFEAHLADRGGVRLIGHAGLHQAWTDYRKTVTYETYDVTKAMRVGPHVLSVMLGNGMYNVQRSMMADGKSRYTKFEGSFGAPKLIAELKLTYSGGRTEVIGTDGSWKVSRGPVGFSSTYGGEDFDARKLEAGWDRVGFEDASWDAAKVVDGPGGTLIAAIAPEVEEGAAHEAIKVTRLGATKVVYDLGQNFAGVASIHVHGAAGTVLKLTPGELLLPDGSVTQRSSGSPMWWTYTLSGAAGGETWEPQFGYYGFRYVQAEWSVPQGSADANAADFHIDDLTGHEWHSASPSTGTFASSSELLNAIHHLIVTAMHNNEASLFTDCPHREKLGWLEETHLVAPGLMFDNDLRGLYAATDRNMSDAQREDGDVPTIAPHYTQFGAKYSRFDDSPEWGSASILAPWAAYRFYGDLGQLRRDYPVMQRYIANLQSRAVDGIVAFGLGDWYDIGPGQQGASKLTTLGVTGTLMLYEDAVAMQKIATLLGKSSDAADYAKLARVEKDAFNARFYDSAQGFYDKGSQTAQAMPLALGIVPEAEKPRVLAHLFSDIHAHEDHVTTGEIGFPYLMRMLMEDGRSDVLLAIMLRKDAPSYGSQLVAGATSLTEAWDANPRSSQDHFMLGDAEEWFYRGLGGIDFDMTRAKAARITIRPQVVDGLDWVRCGYDSVLGKIESDWKRVDGETIFEVTIPAGAQATVVLPCSTHVVGAGVHHFTVRN